MKVVVKSAAGWAFAASVALGAACAHADGPGASPSVFARVGEVEISVQGFEMALAQAARGKFYHGTAPDEQLQALRVEVADRLVDEVLLAREASRRGLSPNPDVVTTRLASLEARYAERAQWRAKVVEMRPQLTRQFEQDDLVAQLEREVRAAARPAAGATEAYYAAHPEKFTEPEQLEASIILLKVDPSSPRDVWEDARAKARALLDEIGAGRAFADVARAFSNDDSAAHAGDLGHLHRGMLAEPAERALASLEAGAVSEPVTLLEGIAILRLDERKPARLQPFEEAARAAAEFARRDAADQAWAALISTLRRDQPPVFLDAAFLRGRGDSPSGAPAR